jgi:hypothetical protein
VHQTVSAEHNSDFEGPAANASGPGLADRHKPQREPRRRVRLPLAAMRDFGLGSGVELSRRRSRSDRPRRKPRPDAGATVYAAIAITRPPRLVTGFGETPKPPVSRCYFTFSVMLLHRWGSVLCRSSPI